MDDSSSTSSVMFFCRKTDSIPTMQKQITIGIPAYNRAQQLYHQLERLAGAMKGGEDDIEIDVSDNCSTHNTQIVALWLYMLECLDFQRNWIVGSMSIMLETNVELPKRGHTCLPLHD